MAAASTEVTTCDWHYQLNPPATSPLGKAIKPSTQVLGCRRNCGRFSDPFTGTIYTRDGKKADNDSCDKADADDSAPSAKRRQVAQGVSTTSSLGILTAQLKYIPWLFTQAEWRAIMELIIAPSVDDRRAAATAVKTLLHGPDTRDQVKKAITDDDSGGKNRLLDLLRFTSPYDRNDVLPCAAAIAAFLAAVDFNAAADDAGRITIARDKLRRKEQGPPLQLQSVIAIHTLKTLLDNGRSWFRALLDAIVIQRQADPTHFVKVPPGAAVSKDSKILVWPIRWAVVLLKSWALFLQARPLDTSPPALFATLTTDAELPVLANPEAHDLTPFLLQGGTLAAAVEQDPHAATAKAALGALERHARHVADKYYTSVIATKASQDNYRNAVKAGATLVGFHSTSAHRQNAGKQPATPQQQPTRNPTRQHPQSSPHWTPAVASGAGSPAASTVHAPSPAAPTAVRPATTGPPPALPPAPAASSGVPPHLAQQAQAGPARTGPRPMFTKCMAPGCQKSPPPGQPSTAPFCRTCGPTHEFNWVTSQARLRP